MIPQQFMQQPAMQAVSEISSNHSDDGLSQLDSINVPPTQRRGRRKAANPVANTMTLNL